MTMTQAVKDWCYAECERQHATTPNDILNMEAAWKFANSMVSVYGRSVDRNDIAIMGQLVDPIANPNGRFRTGPAVFMDGGTAASASAILSILDMIVNAYGTNDLMTPEMFYIELMYCHPFRDGNGRVGSLVYNMLLGTLNNPVVPPPYK